MSPSIRSRTILAAIILALASCAGSPKPQAEEHRSALVPNPAIQYAAQRGLVDVRAVLPDIVCDLRYGTKDNVTRQVLYPPDMPVLLNARTVEKLAIAQAILRLRGFGLKIWDAWRPPEVQVELYKYGLKNGKAELFVDPREAWSFHCSGTAVDVTLVNSAGREMPLPTYFDEAGPRAHVHAPVGSARVRRDVESLEAAMTEAGFGMVALEWWHFDDKSFNTPATRLPVVFAGEIGVQLPLLK